MSKRRWCSRIDPSPGHWRRSPASSSHRTQHADFPHYALRKLVHSTFAVIRSESCCHGWRFFSLHRRPIPPVVWSPCCPRTVQLPLAASPCGRLSRPRSTISQSDFRQVIGSSSPCQLVGPYKLRLNLTDLPCSHRNLWLHAGGTNPGSTPEHSPFAHPGTPSSPLGDRVDYFNHDRFRGYVSVHSRSGLPPPCLRFAVSVAGHHAKLGTRLLARLCRGHHFR